MDLDLIYQHKRHYFRSPIKYNYENIEKNKMLILLLLDLSKAFDSVNHQILINKLTKANFDFFWFGSYISKCVQSVRIGSVLSSAINITFGVPQGSILGPLLFLICIKDLPQYIRNCLLAIYANDTQIMLTVDINDVEALIERAENILVMVTNYFNSNGLLLNENKTIYFLWVKAVCLSHLG